MIDDKNLNIGKTATPTITIDRVRAAYHTMAKIVTLYGDVYLPIFKRLHEELLVLENNCDLKELAKKISG